MVSGKIPKCTTCDDVFDTWEDLARHIWSNKKTHGKSLRFAAKVLAGKDDRPDIKRIGKNPDENLTAFGIEQRANAVRELSGESEFVKTICPNCKTLSNQRLEAEYLTDRYAWRNPNGTLVVNCSVCRKEK